MHTYSHLCVSLRIYGYMSMCISGIYVGVYLRVRVRTCEYRSVLVHIYAYLFVSVCIRVSVRVYTAFAKAYRTDVPKDKRRP